MCCSLACYYQTIQKKFFFSWYQTWPYLILCLFIFAGRRRNPREKLIKLVSYASIFLILTFLGSTGKSIIFSIKDTTRFTIFFVDFEYHRIWNLERIERLFFWTRKQRNRFEQCVIYCLAIEEALKSFRIALSYRNKFLYSLTENCIGCAVAL